MRIHTAGYHVFPSVNALLVHLKLTQEWSFPACFPSNYQLLSVTAFSLVMMKSKPRVIFAISGLSQAIALTLHLNKNCSFLLLQQLFYTLQLNKDDGDLPYLFMHPGFRRHISPVGHELFLLSLFYSNLPLPQI